MDNYLVKKNIVFVYIAPPAPSSFRLADALLSSRLTDSFPTPRSWWPFELSFDWFLPKLRLADALLSLSFIDAHFNSQ